MKDRGGLMELLQLGRDGMTKMVTVLAVALLAQTAMLYPAQSRATRAGTEQPALKIFLGSDGVVSLNDHTICTNLGAVVPQLGPSPAVAVYLPAQGGVSGAALLEVLDQIQAAGGHVLLAGHNTAGTTR